MNISVGKSAPILAMLLVSLFANATNRLYVYPAQGQSEQQQANDRYQCHQWAVRATGFDPMKSNAPPEYVRVTVPENPKEGAAVRGMLGGAVAGAAIGGIDSHNPDKGAVIGAIVGALVGSAVEQKGERQSQRQAEQQAQRIYEDRREAAIARENYNRALSACLEGRGYKVN